MFATLKRIIRLWRAKPPASFGQFMDIVKRRNTPYYWDAMYKYETTLKGKIRTFEKTRDLVPLLQSCTHIMDFGCGVCGNIKVLAEELSNVQFHLVDHSEYALTFSRERVLGEEDKNGNSFHYYRDMAEVPGQMHAILCQEVLEHIPDYQGALDAMWAKLADDGLLIISVPVRGHADKCAEHVNKFTCDTVVQILNRYSDWVSVRPRTLVKRSTALSTAFFMIRKQ